MGVGQTKEAPCSFPAGKHEYKEPLLKKNMIQIDAQKLLDEKLTAEQLFLYLRENMEDPSVDVYEDGYKTVTGFIACDIHGNIVSTFTQNKTPLKFNATKQAIIKHVKSTSDKARLADDRHELAQAWKEKAKELEGALYYTRVFAMILFAVFSCFVYHYHLNLKELNTLKSTIEKPLVIQYKDTLTQK